MGIKWSALGAAGTITGAEIIAVNQGGVTLQTTTGAIRVSIRTAAEIAASVTPVNYAYAPGNVLRYGAVADWNWGTLTGTDNAAAFNNAIQALLYAGGGVLRVPAGAYRIASALNFTGTGAIPFRYGNCPIIVQGDGMGIGFVPGNGAYGGSWICGQTGTWVADCTGTQYTEFRDLGIRGTGTGASKGGVLFARSSTVNFAQANRMKRCMVWIDSSPAFSAVGSIGVANNGAEDFGLDQCWVIADTPYAATFKNSTDLALVSPYTTIYDGTGSVPNSSTNWSAKLCTFQAITKYSAYLQGVQAGRLEDCVYGQYGGANTTNYAIQLVAGGTAGASHCQDIKITGQVEIASGYPGGVLRIDDAATYNIDLDVMHPGPTYPYINTGACVMNGNKYNIHHALGSTGQYILSCAAGAQMNGGEIIVYPGDTGPTANANLAANGVVIRGQNADVSGSLGFATGSTYAAFGTAGTTIQQPIGLAIVPNGANNSNAAASPNVPTSYLKADGTIQLSGTFTPTAATTIAAGTAAGTVALAHRPNREVDATVYISGTLAYARILANGQIILGAAVAAASSQTANIDGISYNLNN